MAAHVVLYIVKMQLKLFAPCGVTYHPNYQIILYQSQKFQAHLQQITKQWGEIRIWVSFPETTHAISWQKTIVCLRIQFSISWSACCYWKCDQFHVGFKSDSPSEVTLNIQWLPFHFHSGTNKDIQLCSFVGAFVQTSSQQQFPKLSNQILSFNQICVDQNLSRSGEKPSIQEWNVEPFHSNVSSPLCIFRSIFERMCIYVNWNVHKCGEERRMNKIY